MSHKPSDLSSISRSPIKEMTDSQKVFSDFHKHKMVYMSPHIYAFAHEGREEERSDGGKEGRREEGKKRS